MQSSRAFIQNLIDGLIKLRGTSYYRKKLLLKRSIQILNTSDQVIANRYLKDLGKTEVLSGMAESEAEKALFKYRCQVQKDKIVKPVPLWSDNEVSEYHVRMQRTGNAYVPNGSFYGGSNQRGRGRGRGRGNRRGNKNNGRDKENEKKNAGRDAPKKSSSKNENNSSQKVWDSGSIRDDLISELNKFSA